MYNYEDILARLRSGESSDAIVKEFTDALNAAEKAQKEDTIQETKIADFKDLADKTLEFFQKYYPEVGFDEVEISEETAAAMLGEMEKEIKIFMAFLAPITMKSNKIEVKTKDPIAEFLNKFVN